jgi:hypothetical protein
MQHANATSIYLYCHTTALLQGMACSMKKRGRCDFAHGGIELRVRANKRDRWGQNVTATGDSKTATASGGEDTLSAARNIETVRSQAGARDGAGNCTSGSSGGAAAGAGRGKRGGRSSSTSSSNAASAATKATVQDDSSNSNQQQQQAVGSLSESPPVAAAAASTTVTAATAAAAGADSGYPSVDKGGACAVVV